MFKITKTNVNNRIIFKYEEVQFRIGDEILFYPPSKDADPGFYNSNVGELFKSGKINSLKFVVIETDCLEIVFRTTLLNNSVAISNIEKIDQKKFDFYL